MYNWSQRLVGIVSFEAASCDSLFFFFFQAEDGIRDLIVTGVQTCALPISRMCRRSSMRDRLGVTNTRTRPADPQPQRASTAKASKACRGFELNRRSAHRERRDRKSVV